MRRSWLCGWHRVRRKDYSHRKVALEVRLLRLVQCFAVELYAFATMSNHFHLVVRYDSLACSERSAHEVAQRWVAAVASRPVLEDTQLRRARVDTLCAAPEEIGRIRERLGSMSAFMQHLKQPIACQANSDVQFRGHFFDQRFYSGALLCEEAVLAAMTDVELNPVRAHMAQDV